MKYLYIAFALTLGSTAAATARADESRDSADRIQNDGERARNRGDNDRAREAGRSADRAEKSTPDRAREIEREYNRGK
ncbi:MAG TPA: hypothetical protein VMF89_20625 [Polyangiales bacterium]|nr:hypothetical protein [Polyangiales bacterium]